MRIYLIRHADPDYPNDSLTPTGHREAQALAELLSGANLDAIYSSPRGRARLTARYTADRLAAAGAPLPVNIEPWANELDGLYTAEYRRSLWDIDGTTLRSPDILKGLDRWETIHPLDHPNLPANLERIRGGSDDFLRRLGFTRVEHAYTFTQPNRQRIAFFAHLGFGLAWLSHLLAIPLPLVWAGFYLHPSSVTTILFDERAPGVAAPRVLGLGDVSHLAKAGLPPTPSGIIANYD